MPDPESAQKSTPQRIPFTLAAVMILVVATAPGLALFSYAYHNNFFSKTVMVLTTSGTYPPGYLFLDQLTVSAWCVLPGLTLTVLILTALRPKPSRRDAIGGPGFVACLIAMLAPVPSLTRFLVKNKEMGRPNANGFGFHNLTFNEFLGQHLVPFLTGNVPDVVGSTIVGGWFALVLVGRWRPKPIWTDRLGYVIGACWVLLYGCQQIYYIVVLPLLQLWGIWSPS